MTAAPVNPEAPVEEVGLDIIPKPRVGDDAKLTPTMATLWIDQEGEGYSTILERVVDLGGEADEDLRWGAFILASDLHQMARACVAALASNQAVRLVNGHYSSMPTERQETLQGLTALATSRETLFGGDTGDNLQRAYQALGGELRRRMAEEREGAR